MRLAAALACWLSIMLSSSIGFADSTQVFPLAGGLEFTYRYVAWRSVSPSGSYSLGYRDSGWVRATIRDSSLLNDSTMVWSFLQTVDVVRHAWNQTLDSTFRISDTVSARLIESLRGYHELACSSLIWRFPSPYWWYPNAPRVFRYADSAQVFAAISLPSPGCVGNWDSVWLSSDSGQFRREYNYCWFDETGIGEEEGLATRLISLAAAGIDHGTSLPTSTRLLQNFPNPFNPSTTIAYELSGRSQVSLGVFDLLGRQVAILVDGIQHAGPHLHAFHASHLPSGVYFYRLHTAHKTEARKMLLLR